jgi:hypothetical protein
MLYICSKDVKIFYLMYKQYLLNFPVLTMAWFVGFSVKFTMDLLLLFAGGLKSFVNPLEA